MTKFRQKFLSLFDLFTYVGSLTIVYELIFDISLVNKLCYHVKISIKLISVLLLLTF